MEKEDLEKFTKINSSIRMLHFHSYISDSQFFHMMDKLNKDIELIEREER